NAFIHPAMEARRPGSSRGTADEHKDHERAFVRLAGYIGSVERCEPKERAATLETLYHQLALFVADNFTHTFAEETYNQPVLWEAYSDQELKALEAVIVASHTPAQQAIGLRWMIPALAPAERELLLAGPRQGMPTYVFDQLLGYCVSLLD